MLAAGPHVARVHVEPGPGPGAARPTILAHIRAAAAAARGSGFAATVFQVFVAGPRARAFTVTEDEADELRAFLAPRPHLRVIAHGTFTDVPWNGAPHAAKFIRLELERCQRARIEGLVIHLGRTPPATVAKVVPRLLTADAPDVLLYLETPAVKAAASHYESPEKLAALFRRLRKADPGLCRLGLCIDTAHLWSSGVDLSSYEGAEAWLARLEACAADLPFDRLLFHLNDSLDSCGGGRDRHAPLLEGEIWKEYAGRARASGLAAVVDFLIRHGVAAVLERRPASALLGDYAILGLLA
jgi:endonuclease IV